MSMSNTGFVPMKRTKERQENNKQATPETKGKKWQRNDNKRSYENG
ncbi:MAG: hypothetical protein ACXW1D_00315 [Halobacteriota archaeon]